MGNFVVDTAEDTVDENDGLTSLREAVALANADADFSTITFDATATDFTDDALIRLTGGVLRVTESVSIDGTTAGGAVVITGDANGNDITVAGSNITNVAASLAVDVSADGIDNDGDSQTDEAGENLLDDNSRLFSATGDAGLSLTALTLTGGRTTGGNADGGAIRSANGAVTLTGSTVSGNSTAGNDADGGGIFSASGGVMMTNSTLSGNGTVGGNADGGGIFSLNGGVTLANSTLSGNSTAGDFANGGGIFSVRGGVNLTDSIVSGNVSGNGSVEIIGTPTLSGGNIVGSDLFDGENDTGDVTAAQIFDQTEEVINGNGFATGVFAGVLADNGGPTETILILTGGAAQDAGGPTTLTTDQRGEARPEGDNDLGAVELQREPGSLVVTISDDIVDAFDGETSLREAVAFANAQAGADMIEFDATSADFTGDALIRLTQGQLRVTDSLTIDGSTAGGAVVITGDANGNDITVAGTDITDVSASLASSALLSNGQDDDNDGRIDNQEEDPNDLLDDNSRLFEATGSAALSMTALTLTGGRTTGVSDDGGAILSRNGGAVTLTDSTLSGNSTAGQYAVGGGIFSFEEGVTLVNSTLSGNSTAGENADGGGIFSFDGGVMLTGSTLSGNSTAGENAGGGGIFSVAGGVMMTNSTLSGNSTAGERANGGGVYSGTGGVTLANSTLSGNSTAGEFASGGGISSFRDGVNLTDSIVSGNVSGNGSGEILGAQTLSGGNIVGGDLFDGNDDIGSVTAAQIFDQTEEVIDANGNATGVQAGVLADNGGATETILILTDGAAQDAGGPTTLTTDQRGEARPVGDNDLGAVELQQAPEPGSLIVTIAGDIVDAFDGETSLREAVAFANDAAGENTITFDATSVDFDSDALIRLTEGQLVVTETLSISGSTAGGAVVITGDADGDDITIASTDITDVAASLAGPDLLDDNSRLFIAIGENTALSLTALTLTGGRTMVNGGDGGAIFSSANGAVTLIDSTLSGNSTAGNDAQGGAIRSADGAVTLIDSTLSGNSTEGVGSQGGGIFTLNGAVTLMGSTLSGNSTTGGTAFGGGISSFFGGVTLTNSTLSGNSTAGSEAGGGGILSGYGGVTLINSTISGNSTASDSGNGGGIYSYDGGVALTDSIVSGNVSGDGSGEIDGTQSLSGGNIVGNQLTRADGTTATVTAAEIFDQTEEVIDANGNATGVQAGVLADNGGPTETILIHTGGAAQDAGGPTALTTDQRGEARPFGDNDLGAVELQTAPPEPPSLIVTIAGDIVDAFDGQTSLREAVAFANAQPGVDTITFDATAADFQGDALIRLTQGQLLVTDSLTIDGTTAGGAVVISGDAADNDVTVGNTDITDVAASLAGPDLLDDNSRLFEATGTVALSLTALTLTGGRTTVDNFRGGGGGIFSYRGDVTLTDSTLSGNSTAGYAASGGGIFSLDGAVTLTGSTLSGNSAAGAGAQGGAIRSQTGAVTLTDSTVSGNVANGGGGISSSFGDVMLVDSTLSGNNTVGNFANAGGIYSIDGAVTLTNSTLSGNSTANNGIGGGILSIFGGVTLTNSTLSGNSTAGNSAYGGGIFSYTGGVTLTDSIVSGNVSGDGSGEIDNSGAMTLNGGNIVGGDLFDGNDDIGDVSAAEIFDQTEEVIDANGNATGVQTGVLADNGGPTETILILTGGAAQGTGGPTALTTDQRGEARPVGDNDLGAVELQVAPNSPPTITSVGATFVTETTDDSPIERSRVVSFEDVDLADDHTVTIAFNRVSDGVAPALTDAELTALLSAGPVMQAAGSTTRTFDYTFSAPSTAFDYLAEGETVTLNYTLTIDDGNGGVLTRTPNVVVTGTDDDAPVVVADSHIEFDSAKLRLEAGGNPTFVQVALHEGGLNGVDDLEYTTNGTRKDASDDVLGPTLIASELYKRSGGGRFEDDSLETGDLRDGVQDIGGTRTVEGELLNPLLGDILSIDAFKIRQDADAVPDSFIFAGDDADGFDPDSGQTVLKGGQGLRANGNGFGLEFGIDRNGAGKPDFAGDGGPTKEIAGPEVLLFTLDDDLVGTGVSFGVDRATDGAADVALDFYEIDRDTGLYTLIETRTVTEADDGAPTGPGDPLAALDFAFDAVAFSSADGDRFRLEQLEIGTFADLG